VSPDSFASTGSEVEFLMVQVSPHATRNLAVTILAEVIDSVQSFTPVQLPVYPTNTNPEAGVAWSVTDWPCGNPWAHPVPQLMPAGMLVTVPLPSSVTDSVYVFVVVQVMVTTPFAA
jgi:hypothetical protein